MPKKKTTTPMPRVNHAFESVPQNANVELCGDTNQYYVATVQGVKGVVIMEGQKQKEQQAKLDEMIRDTKMRIKGYRYKLLPNSGKFEPLYVKTADEAGPVMLDYPDEMFNVVSIWVIEKPKMFRVIDDTTGENVVGGDVERNNATLTMWMEAPVREEDKFIDDLFVNESSIYRFRASGTTGVYRVIRVQ